MKDFVFVVSLSLLSFGLVNLLFSLLVALGAPLLRFDCEPRARARKYLLVRAFPGAASILFVVAFFAPVLCRHEPNSADEQLSLALGVVATLSASIVVAAIARGLKSLQETRRLSKAWKISSRPVALRGCTVPAFVVESAYPVVAIVGVGRPRLYVARKVVEKCSREEFDAILSHEQAHIRNKDNLSRLLLRCFPDFLAFTPTASWLERGWRRACEEAADDAAVAAGSGLDLASALCKVARLARGSLPIATMSLHGDGDVAHRVGRLIRPETVSPARGQFDHLKFAILLVLPLLVANAELRWIRALTEAVVRILE